MLVIGLFYIASTIVKIWVCTKTGNKTFHGTCASYPSILNTSGLFNTISDVLILLVPIKSVWNLNMDKAWKIGVVLVFTVGLM